MTQRPPPPPRPDPADHPVDHIGAGWDASRFVPRFSARSLLLLGAVALALVAFGFWLYTPTPELEEEANEAEKARAVTEQKARDDVQASRAALDGLQAGHAATQRDDGRIADLERQIAEIRAQQARAQRQQAERTQARAADLSRIGELREAELYARVVEALGKAQAP